MHLENTYTGEETVEIHKVWSVKCRKFYERFAVLLRNSLKLYNYKYIERPVLRPLDAAIRLGVKSLVVLSKIGNCKCGYQNSLCGFLTKLDPGA